MAPNNPVMRSSDGICIKDYVDTRFNEAQRAIDKAEKMMGDRLAAMNEFRSQLKDQAGRFVTRDELKLISDKLSDDVDALEKIADVAEGKASQSSMIFSYAISIISLIIAVASLLTRMK